MRLVLSLVLLGGLAAGCADAPDGPTLDGTAPPAPTERVDPEAVAPSDSLRPDAGLAPGEGMAPPADLTPDASLAP